MLTCLDRSICGLGRQRISVHAGIGQTARIHLCRSIIKLTVICGWIDLLFSRSDQASFQLYGGIYIYVTRNPWFPSIIGHEHPCSPQVTWCASIQFLLGLISVSNSNFFHHLPLQDPLLLVKFKAETASLYIFATLRLILIPQPIRGWALIELELSVKYQYRRSSALLQALGKSLGGSIYIETLIYTLISHFDHVLWVGIKSQCHICTCSGANGNSVMPITSP